MRLTSRAFESHLEDEHGSVVVFVAVTLMVLVLIAVFVVDLGNWFVHKRHLQTQADAAALAAADSLGYPCDWTAAQSEGSLYGDGLNPQVGGANRGDLTLLFNSKTFASGTPPAPDDTVTGSSCETSVVDVKATESNLPLFFAGAVPGLDVVINAHARAMVSKVTQMSGFLPLAVEDSDPKYVFARFTQADGTPVLTWLTKGDPQIGSTPWTTSAPLAVPVSSSLSLQIGLVYSKTKRTDCAAFPAVQCYDDVSYVRAWNAAPAPVLEDVRIRPGTCAPDGYFATAPCALGLEAVLDLGDRPLSGTGVTTKVWATIAGDNTKYPLTTTAAGPGAVTWSRDAGIPLTSAPDTSAITVHWDWKRTSGDGCTNAHPCTLTGSETAQRAYLADDSIPLEGVQIGESPGLTAGANTFQAGGTHNLLVTVGVHNSLAAAADSADPTVMLRTASGSGSNSQALDCDAGVTFRDEIVAGCTTTYQLNQEAVCPNGDSPASCILTQPGDFLGQLRQGLDDRFGCPVNNWGIGSPGNITADDPRLVALLIVPPATFADGGSHLVPVVKFAFFYVTGWDGNGTCGANQPYPGTGAPHGDVWGHFVKYTGFVPDTVPSDDPCDLQSDDPGACVVALTR